MKNKQRLIDHEQAIRATYEEIFWTESEQAVVRHFLAKLPKIYATELVRGKWVTDEKGKTYCGRCRVIDDYASVHNYCPFCGAKMDE